jgi:DNA-binding IclR family transcriptional regulator
MFHYMEQAPGAIEKALDVLFHLHAAHEAQGVSELGRALGLPKSSAHRLLAALGRRGLVERDELGRYRPGIALVALGLGTLAREPVVEAARPVLQREAEELGETLFLAAARAGRIHVLDKAEGSGFLRAAPSVGATVPVHATAVGKLHLAFAPDDVELDDERALERYTARTLRGRGLAQAVARARKRGWSENRDEWQAGLAAVAAPIFLSSRMVGAVAAAAPSARLPESDVARVAARVVAAARRVSARLSGGAR